MTPLQKCVWSDADYEQMGWHDASVYAMAIDWDAARFPEHGAWRGADLFLDIDYIVSWIRPHVSGGAFEFSVAPATLVFEDSWDVAGQIDLADNGTPEVLDLHRVGPSPESPRSWLWHLEGDQFDLRFRAGGFRQHFRRRPIRVAQQRLTRIQRGALSFDCPTAFPASTQ